MGRTYATVLVAVAVVVAGTPAAFGAVGPGDATPSQTGVEAQTHANDALRSASAAPPDATGPNRVAQGENATVTLENQTSDGTTVTVASATLPEGGFVAIHDERLLNGTVLESVRGASAYLESGTTENVTVELDEPIEESQQLVAVAYRDTNDDQEYDFVESTGADDGAYVSDNQVVTDTASVEVDADVTPTTPETTTETPTETTTEETTTPETTTTTPETETPETETPTTTPETTTPETETPTETIPETPTEITTIETTTETPTETTPETPTETTTTETTTTETTPETTTTTPETETPTTTTPETTTPAEPALPTDQRQVTVPIDSANVVDFSLVVGEGEVDRTVVIENASVADQTLSVNLTKILYGASVDESVGENADVPADIDDAAERETVRFAFRDVTVRNVEYVLTLPEDASIRLDEAPPDDLPTTTETPTETTTTEVTPTETTTTEVTPTETTPETETPTETTPETTTTTPETTTTPDTTTTTPETTTTEAPDEEPSLEVSDLDVPATIVLNEGELVVNARVVNPSEEALSEPIQLRIGGTVVAQEQINVGPGADRPVQFRIDRADLDVEPGETFVGVLTRDFGQVTMVTVRETGQPDEPGTTAPETTTTTATETTPEDTPTVTETTPEETTTTEAPEETTTDETTRDAPETTTAEDRAASLRVSGLDAPDAIVLDGRTVVVSADLTNPTDETVTDTAQLRVDGTVVAERQVEVGPDGSESVSFEVGSRDLGLESDEAFLEVLTRKFGESVRVTVESESGDGTTTEADA